MRLGGGRSGLHSVLALGTWLGGAWLVPGMGGPGASDGCTVCFSMCMITLMQQLSLLQYFN